MISIAVTKGEEVKTKYNLFYNGKKLKQNKEIHLQENSFLLFQERSIFSNKFIYIICWIFLALYSLFKGFATGANKPDPEIKQIKKIQINYYKILSEEITIKILKDNVEVTGLEIESIVIDGIKMGEPKNKFGEF